MDNGATPLFEISLASEIESLQRKCVSLEKERDAVMGMNAKLQEAMAKKDACILTK